MTYDEALAYLADCNRYAGEITLEPLKELLRALGNPQDDLKFVHIAGTNGKGSVLAFLASVLREAGYTSGQYSSPAVWDYRERFQVNGEYISKNDVARLAGKLKETGDELLRKGRRHPTTFEMETALAFLYFKEKGCTVVLLETGRGGRTDATNVVTTTVAAVLASISMDHMDFLGNSLAEIAGHKAGIIKEGCAVVTLKQEREAEAVIAAEAEAKGCRVLTADPVFVVNRQGRIEKQSFDYKGWKGMETSLVGEYQYANAAVALETVAALRERGYRIGDAEVREGLRKASWGGRFTRIAENPDFILDGAHNPDAARMLRRTIDGYLAGRRIVMICGVLADKEYETEMRLLAPCAAAVITVTPPDNPRALPAEELARTARKYFENVQAAGSLKDAVERAYRLVGNEDVILAFGSLSYLGELAEIIKKRRN